jgi:hypothetical protein
MRLHGVVLNWLSTRTTLPLTFMIFLHQFFNLMYDLLLFYQLQYYLTTLLPTFQLFIIMHNKHSVNPVFNQNLPV